jgi:hypothetical protein
MSGYEFPIEPIASTGEGLVTIWISDRDRSMISKSSIGSAAAARSNPYRYVAHGPSVAHQLKSLH